MPLAHTKNGDKQFWKERFDAANGKAQHALMMGPGIFFWGGDGGSYFLFFLPCSQCIH